MTKTTTQKETHSVTTLNQIIAVEKGTRSTAERVLTDAYHDVQKDVLINGLSRKYNPKDDEGDTFPDESTGVQLTVEQVLKNVSEGLTRSFDVTFTKEQANAEASASIKVDERVILADVPVTYLLFLEKKLVDLRTFVSKLPILDPAVKWSSDDENLDPGVSKSEVTTTNKTKKVMRNHVVAEATDKHPAQVQVYTEDEIIGTWDTTKFSGAIPASRRAELLARVNKLADAVQYAREEANSMEITDHAAGEAIFGYLFA